jgi:hypothetical protein
MQKLDLRKKLKEIIDKTKSEKILEFFQTSSQLKGSEYSSRLINTLVESKAGFDQSILDEKQNKILEQFEAHKYFDTKFFSIIMRFVSVNNYELTKQFLQNSKQLTDFYTFHNTLITTYRLVDNLLFQDADLKESVSHENYEDAENQGFISFEIISDNGINFQSFSIVISNLNSLIKTVTEFISQLNKVDFEENPKLLLADSGSNTVISLKLPKEISKTIAKIIDDAWLFFTNKTGYNLKKANNNLEESLEIIAKLKKAEKEKLISPEQTEIFKRQIVSSTEAILMNKTLTKSKSEEMYTISNQKMLTEATNKYLTEGEK